MLFDTQIPSLDTCIYYGVVDEGRILHHFITFFLLHCECTVLSVIPILILRVVDTFAIGSVKFRSAEYPRKVEPHV